MSIRRRPNKKQVYWWNEEIAEVRRTCFKKRRQLPRAEHRDVTIYTREYKEANKALKTLILKSKAQHWRTVSACEEADKDIRGSGYKIISKKLKSTSPLPLSIIKMCQAMVVLFSKHKPFLQPDFPDTAAPEVTLEEFKEASRRIKANKSPGLDVIFGEIVKLVMVVETVSEKIRKVMNDVVSTGEFPEKWKLCLLDCYGKLLEKIILNRLNNIMDQQRGLSEFPVRVSKSKVNIRSSERNRKFRGDG